VQATLCLALVADMRCQYAMLLVYNWTQALM
jgi:hypothetical protein